MSSVFFAVFFCVVYSSYERGVWDRMIENTLNTQAGHIQIHNPDYWDDKVVDNFMFMDWETIKLLDKIDNITNVSPRVETFAMANFENANRGIAVIGISPEREKQKSNLPNRLIIGEYLSEDDDGILIGEGLSNFLRATVGDTLALIGQGFQGASAAQLFPIRGIVSLMTIEMDNSIAYISLPAAQQFIDMPDGYSGILISIANNNRLEQTMRDVSLIIEFDSLIVNSLIADSEDEMPSNYQTQNYETQNRFAVYSWHFTMQRLLQTSESNRAFLVLIMGILYIIVGFGILGTVIMMTNERTREFSVMISLGMSRLKLSRIVAAELFLQSLMGTALAIFVTVPMAWYFHHNPIPLSGEMATTMVQFGIEPLMPMAFEAQIFFNQVVTILIISMITVIYPVRKIMKLNLSKNK